jgi:hypothetical protein
MFGGKNAKIVTITRDHTVRGGFGEQTIQIDEVTALGETMLRL